MGASTAGLAAARASRTTIPARLPSSTLRRHNRFPIMTAFRHCRVYAEKLSPQRPQLTNGPPGFAHRGPVKSGADPGLDPYRPGAALPRQPRPTKIVLLHLLRGTVGLRVAVEGRARFRLGALLLSAVRPWPQTCASPTPVPAA